MGLRTPLLGLPASKSDVVAAEHDADLLGAVARWRKDEGVPM